MSDEESEYLALYEANVIPLRVCLMGLTWGLHDYFVTLEDEIRYIWPRKFNLGQFLFYWIRYYTLLLLVFDVVQIHVFAIPGVPSNELCVAMDSIIRIVCALNLWPVEIFMQLRIYAIYGCSWKVATFNFVLFLGSLVGFMWILVRNAERRSAEIAEASKFPLPGCPAIHSGIEWAQWIPAAAYEIVLFAFALYQTFKSSSDNWKIGNRLALRSLLLRDNIFYFFGIMCILIFNNLMVVRVTKIPWFSYAPFHAVVGILTTRLMISMRKASSDTTISAEAASEIAFSSLETSSGISMHRLEREGRSSLPVL